MFQRGSPSRGFLLLSRILALGWRIRGFRGNSILPNLIKKRCWNKRKSYCTFDCIPIIADQTCKKVTEVCFSSAFLRQIWQMLWSTWLSMQKSEYPFRPRFYWANFVPSQSHSPSRLKRDEPLSSNSASGGVFRWSIKVSGIAVTWDLVNNVVAASKLQIESCFPRLWQRCKSCTASRNEAPWPTVSFSLKFCRQWEIPVIVTSSTVGMSSSKWNQIFSKSVQDRVSTCVQESKVLSEPGSEWNWNLVIAILKWPGEAFMDSNINKQFMRRISDYFKPSGNGFHKLELQNRETREIAQAGCAFFQFLLKDPTTDSIIIFDDLIGDIKNQLNLLITATSAHDCLFSPTRVASSPASTTFYSSVCYLVVLKEERDWINTRS